MENYKDNRYMPTVQQEIIFEDPGEEYAPWDHAPWEYASLLIRENHYLGNIPNTSTHAFTVKGAAAIYGTPHAPKIPEGYIELNRLVANTELQIPLSSFLSKSIRELKKEGWKACLTWADPSAGHHGGIYQATNWVYAEPRSYNWNYSFRTPSGEVIDHRKAFQQFGTSSKTKVLRLRPELVAFLPPMKLRYIMPLNLDIAKCLKELRSIQKPYPKPRGRTIPRPPMKQRSQA